MILRVGVVRPDRLQSWPVRPAGLRQPCLQVLPLQGPPLYEVVQNQQQPQSTGPQANTGSTAQQTTGPQQPTQMQNSAGPGQAFLPPQGYPQPIYYVGNPFSQLGYTQDPFKMAYPNLPVQQYMTVPQPVANFPPAAQQVLVIVILCIAVLACYMQLTL